ncbi:Asp-tRNA(Asn)/Glu-tRNA(Gln) amidotransferase subunit GatA [Candidatus Parcubacteria bacterium]|jgi:aspartyl-tRNA(Asn)/glutamyl-tRNA(Gln) amidotransferase subunit A|nr:MAG: Asp-tRNA(Asn)/Glu-tRNA(Gln) amidotransferase subunit GatA [Candidatus Parcubacteria bacterium]
MNIEDFSISSFHNALCAKEFSAREAIEESYKTIEKNKDLNAFITLTKEEAISVAADIDVKIAKKEDIPLLGGLPIALKDNMLLSGFRASAGSKILSEYKAVYDGTVVKKLKDSGAAIIGKTNMDEFAMGSSNENSAFGPVKNPHDSERVSGGSSGGSAVSVASGAVLAAFGSDTGGSIRQPAAFCGVVGLKPTYGSVSRFGLIAMASSLDQIGPFTKSVADSEIMFHAIQGKDKLDATTFEHKTECNKKEHLVIGVPKEYFIDGIDPYVSRHMEKTMNVLKKLGYSFKEISLPHTKYALSTYYIIMPAEVSTNLARFDGVRYLGVSNIEKDVRSLKELYIKTRGAGFGGEARRRVLLGTFVLSSGYYDAYYAKAQKVRALISNDFDNAFKDVDVIFTPVTPTPAFKIGEKTNDPLSMYLSDIFTIPVNLAGLPAISIPTKKYVVGSGELPVNFQLIGKHYRETDLFEIGKKYENNI